ncbi:MAG: flagellar basal body rod protein FlgB [Gammaproteobacteria bacterium]
MSMFESVLGTQIRSLQVRAQRTELLANNIANVETPNFKARDIDFKAAMSQASESLGMRTSHHGHIATGQVDGGAQANAGYRVPTQEAADGNTVESHVEKAEFAENATRYVADLTFMKSRVQGLIRAMGRE